MVDDVAEVEKKKPDLPSKTPKPNSVSAKAGGGGGIVLALKKKPDLPSKTPKPNTVSAKAGDGGGIVLALGKLKKRKQGEEGNVKKKRILNEKGDEGEEGSDDLPEDVKEGAVMMLGKKKKPDLPSKTPKPNSVSAKAGGGGGIILALKKKPDLPSKTPKPNSVSAKAGGGGGIVLALGKLKKRKQGEEGNVKKKKRILNEKGDEWEEGSDDLPEDVKEGAVMMLGKDPGFKDASISVTRVAWSPDGNFV
ncbi:hypothetical protein OIU84_027823, partial [Salix udensis]